jgi:crotonobetainyl-CoA:carnitine CoA-transferase CaiB-like acyl-CoA transferase
MAITGPRDGEPTKVGVALGDVLTAHYAVAGILAALFSREKIGRGETIEISLFGSAVASLINVAQAALVTGNEARRHGNEHPSIVPYQLFHASDRPFVIGAGTDRHFANLCKDVLRKRALATDERFATNVARVGNRTMLIPILEAGFKRRKAVDWVEACRKANVPAALVQGVREALRSPAGEKLLVDIDHPLAGELSVIANPLRFSGRRLPVRRPPPLLGEHTDSVLRELGITGS